MPFLAHLLHVCKFLLGIYTKEQNCSIIKNGNLQRKQWLIFKTIYAPCRSSRESLLFHLLAKCQGYQISHPFYF